MEELDKNNNDFQTDWAFNDDFTKYIHISEAKSGLNGYYCLGCKKQMQAVKGKIRTHYFRHHAKDVDKNTTECVVANRKYRELIARDILHRLKELKVPAVYKFPPKNIDGLPNELKPSETIKAHRVKSELTFYEDEDCKVRHGQNPNIDERYLLIRPDITFFNEKNQPLLLVEFVVTHKIDNEKRAKLKRLGLNTVQIIIPKKPEPEIEKALKTRSKVKWVYHEIEANTNYVFVSKSTDSRIWEIDDDQKRIFEESYKCRTSQIKYLIRSVKRALESQSYQRIEQHFESEISRVERATESERKKLGDMENRFENEIRAQLAGEFQAIEFQENQFNEEERSFQKNTTDLENRYFDKIAGIRQEQREISNLTREELEDHRTEDEIKEQFRDKAESMEGDFITERRRIERNIETQRKRIEELIQEKASLTKQFGQLERDEQNEFERKTRELGEEEANLEGTVREEFYRDVRTNPRKFSKGVKNILEAQRMGHDFEDAKCEENRYKRARELFVKGAWKTW